MKKVARIVLASVIGLALMAPAGFAADLEYSGFLGKQYGLLKPGPEGGAKMRWLKPGVDFSKYKKFMVDSVVFFLANDSDYKGIDPTEMKILADGFNKAIVDALKDKYPIVSQPGPDVARVAFAITDLKQSRPALSAVSSIMPVGLGISIVKKGATGTWTGAGSTSAEVIALDSMTNEVIALAADKRTAGFEDRFSKWGSADEAFKFWGGTLRKFMDNVTSSKSIKK